MIRFVRKYHQHFISCRSLGLLVMLWLTAASCSNTKYLQKNQALLVSTKVSLKGDLTSSEKEDLKNSLLSPSILLQKPNRTFLGMRIPLWLYNQKYKEEKSSWFWNLLLTDKNIEPPAIFDSAKTLQSAQNMANYLNNQGYFYASVNYNQKVRRQKAGVTYNVNTGKNFTIDSIDYAIPDTAIRRIVLDSRQSSLIKPGTPFKVETLAEEQDRITRNIRNEGYFKFTESNVKFVVDTINKEIFRNALNPFENIMNIYNLTKRQQTPTMSITVRIEPPPDSMPYRQYRIRHIYVYPDYTYDGSPDDSTFLTTQRRGLTIRYHKELVKPKVLARAIYFKPGDLYSEDHYNYTVRKLNELGIWKFVTVEMDTVSRRPGVLDCYVFLIPGRKQEIGADLETTTSADYFIGGALNLTYRNKNINKAANLLTTTLKGGVEWNSDSTRSFFIQARELSGQVNISFPRFITPWKVRDAGRFSDARTHLGVGFNYLDRLRFFTLTSFNGSFGYDWDETEYKHWIVKPFSYEYNHLFHVTDSFQRQLDANPFLRNSLQSTFIGGEVASFIYNNQDPLHQRSFNYLRINLDESGLLLSGINGLLLGASGGKTDFATLTSVGFSRYIKADAEYKHYFNRKHSTLVARIYGGVGVPYGGSEVLPYVKQFTAGGPNSMRAWRLRTLGPGSYRDPNLNNPDVFIDQTGEMKLEGNLEYRFDILKLFGGFMMLKGALFTDAGNIWNLHMNPYKPGAEFRLNRFYQDIAVGAGVGFRLDFSYAVIRLDFATPLKIPYEPEHYGWVLNRIQPSDRQWRRNNIIFNFAVGYPF